MRIFALAVLAVTAFASAPSFAQDAAGQTYINGGYNHFQNKTSDTGTVNGRVGYQFTPNFAVEGEPSREIRLFEPDPEIPAPIPREVARS